MTKDEAISLLTQVNKILVNNNSWLKNTHEPLNMAFDMAIKALEQEPCEDCISREAVIASIKNLYPDMPVMDIFGARRKWLDKYAPYFECENAVEQLPSVKLQEPKTGHWILADEQNKEDVENDNYRFICSECQCSDIHAKGTIVPYCWKCGAKMIEPKGRGDK